VDEPPVLTPPHEVLARLVERARAFGGQQEKTYLRSLNPRHRWVRGSFDGVDEEFGYKTIWVAKLLRDHHGSPQHDAFVSLRYAGVDGIRAAAWNFGSIVGYVLERRGPWSRRRVILGALDVGGVRVLRGLDDLDARDAVWVPIRVH
jgi:hypothetical protein